MHGATHTDLEARRRRARRTALLAGGFAFAVFVVSILQMLKV